MPNGNFYAQANDGYVGHTGTNYSTVRAATTGTWVNTTGTEISAPTAFKSGADYYYYRGRYPFDLSSIPATAIITKATFYIWVGSSGGDKEGLYVVQTTQADLSATSDFNQTNFGGSTPTSYGSIAAGSITNNAYNAIEVDPSLVVPGGTWYMGLRADADFNATDSGGNWQNTRFSEYAGTANDPYLYLEWIDLKVQSELATSTNTNRKYGLESPGQHKMVSDANGYVYTVYQDGDTGTIYLARSKEQNQPDVRRTDFYIITLVGTGGCVDSTVAGYPDGAASIYYYNNRLHLVWARSTTGQIRYSRCVDLSTINALGTAANWKNAAEDTAGSEQITNSFSAAVSFADMVISGNGNIHIACASRTSGSNNDIFYIQHNGTAWQTPVNLTSDGTNVLSAPTLEKDSVNKLHLAWANSAGGIYYKKCTVANGSTTAGDWKKLDGTAGSDAAIGAATVMKRPCIAVATSDQPFVVATANASNNIRWNEASSDTWGTENSTDMQGGYATCATDGQGNVVVAWAPQNGSNSYDYAPFSMIRDSGSWVNFAQLAQSTGSDTFNSDYSVPGTLALNRQQKSDHCQMMVGCWTEVNGSTYRMRMQSRFVQPATLPPVPAFELSGVYDAMSGAGWSIESYQLYSYGDAIIVDDNGNLHFVYTANARFTSTPILDHLNCFWTYSTDDGATWATPTRMTDLMNYRQPYPCLAFVPAGRTYNASQLFYFDNGLLNASYQHQVWWKKRDIVNADPASWGAWTARAVAAGTAGYNNYHPNAIVDSQGLVHLFWVDGGEGSGYSRTYHTFYNGTSWSSPQAVGEASYTEYYPSVAIDSSDNIWVAWVRWDTTATNRKIRYVKMTKDAGDSWTVGTINTLIENNANTYFPFCTYDSTHVYWDAKTSVIKKVAFSDGTVTEISKSGDSTAYGMPPGLKTDGTLCLSIYDKTTTANDDQVGTSLYADSAWTDDITTGIGAQYHYEWQRKQSVSKGYLAGFYMDRSRNSIVFATLATGSPYYYYANL